MISPLAKKLCTARGIEPATLKGSGPRGRIMAADVPLEAVATAAPAESEGLGQSRLFSEQIPPTRPEKEGYYIYDCEVDMRALASMSLPIAVQCDRLLAKSYSLMDYIVRATVRACAELHPEQVALDLLLFEERGEKLAAIRNASRLRMHELVRLSPEQCTPPPYYKPHIVICDSQTSRAQVAEQLEASRRPRFALVIRSHTPSVGIRVGAKVKEMGLPYSFYVSTEFSQPQADLVAARLRTLLHDPVSLLLIS